MLKTTQSNHRYQGADIDLAPMIDCIFILLIFFIVTSVFVEDPGIQVDKPDVSGADNVNNNILLIAISAEDRIYFDGQEIRLEQVAGLIQQASFGKETPLIIRADRATSHGMFANVYSEARRSGVAQVQFATAEKEEAQ